MIGMWVVSFCGFGSWWVILGTGKWVGHSGDWEAVDHFILVLGSTWGIVVIEGVSHYGD